MTHSFLATPILASARFSTVASAILGALVLGGPFATAHPQSGWARYKPGTIATVMQRHDSTIRADHVANHPGVIVSGDGFPTLARVVYRGDSRPLNPKRVDVLKEWGLTFLKDSTIVKDFHRE